MDGIEEVEELVGVGDDLEVWVVEGGADLLGVEWREVFECECVVAVVDDGCVGLLHGAGVLSEELCGE